jgi:hypothetical protein
MKSSILILIDNPTGIKVKAASYCTPVLVKSKFALLGLFLILNLSPTKEASDNLAASHELASITL